MELVTQISINQFGQGICSIDSLMYHFDKLSESEKRVHLSHVYHLIVQSKTQNFDIDFAIRDSSLKPTFTPCVLLRRFGLKLGLPKVINLPADELLKVYTLLLFLFKIGYQRRFEEEKNHPGKWWYSDLSNDANVRSILGANKELS